MATSPVSIGSSSIDVASIVTNLVANKRKAQDEKFADVKQANTTQISAVGNFTSSLTSLQSAIKALTDGTAFKTQKVSVGESKALTATVDATAQPNTYKIRVEALAAAQKTTSTAFASSKLPIGTGNVTISIGDKSMSLDVTADANSLESVRDAINKAKDNPGVTASIVTGTDGAHLVLTSVSTGKDNAFTVKTSGGDGNLARLDFDPATDTAQTPAQDAVFYVDDVRATSASNTATSAIDGVTLSLTTVTPADTPTVLTIVNDPSAVNTALNSLVTSYNAFISTYKQLTKYDEQNQQVGALIGDATVNSIKSQIGTLLGSQSTGNAVGARSLSDLGVAFQTDGTLKLDSTKLTKVLANSPKDVQNLLSGDNGLAPKLDKLITGWTAKDGILTQRSANLQQKTKDIQKDMDAFEVKMKDYGDRLTKQYAALDAMMTKLAGTSSYLQQQFDALTASK
ncbi:flagellar hook-associated protein 2 [Luteibacter sp. UNCMF331Sha3.1]|uniref:flagellar filament capping protein FliD n=1 Tax=Luteibacter sp. UNCMF331Sha3.1 TaxID=1502760 RepID=UPI0008BE21A5|nr:flagellar filament capping protein FliD [Luteibacter sp. UNCMF331Sha3.1]SEM27811.1 flagellar hook-associated protein 2 [Luteibacter sp. UNCMF331Sha3.1]